ncbi:AT-hook motif nuclear-localized protein 10-like isoform X3 [Zingiber officinale]|uniref:AT-hook motif nuclear-localized protein 10-like isoform X3 n=1 Tax=Zingiber officinale TaxID=94328 RepID=UPI001C4AA95D|nr:AT-hook motif nuclear-localized protein 10-like isoform X3 [Zingiber officinale]
MEGQSIANPRESSSIDLQSMAMHGGSSSYLTDDPLLLTMISSSSAAHPQLPPSYQGNGGGGGGNPEAIDGGSVAQTANGLNPNTGEPETKRKRGRPRKYGPDGPILAPSSSSALLSSSELINGPKRRGRPLGSTKKHQMVAQGTAKLGSCLHLICVNEGEGWFEILSLTGSFHNSSDRQSLMGGLTVSVADSKGNVVGGRIAGSFVAASPVLVVLGSFIPGRLELKETNAVPSPNLVSGGTTNTGNSSSRAAFSVPSGDPMNPPIQSPAICSDINSLDRPVKRNFDQERGGVERL